jgi:tetratricopeptide (TPR) repeat protein
MLRRFFTSIGRVLGGTPTQAALGSERELLKGVDHPLAKAKLHVPLTVSKLVDEAWRYYSEGSYLHAGPIFISAIQLAPDAPADPEVSECVDMTDLGHAVWAAWVCFGFFKKGDQTDVLIISEQQFFELAARKSPTTLQRIQDRILENEQEAEQRKFDDQRRAEGDGLLREILAVERNYRELYDKVSQLLAIRTEQDRWWAFRDDGKALTKAGLYDAAWRCYGTAVSTVIRSGNLSKLRSIYEAMGDQSKKEGKHKNAVRDYLLACKFGVKHDGTFPKRAADQVRISLKKAGLKKGSAELRDELLGIVVATAIGELLDMVDSRLNG